MISYQCEVKKKAKEIRKAILESCRSIFPIVRRKRGLTVDDVTFRYIHREEGYWHATLDNKDSYIPPVLEGMYLKFVVDDYLSIDFRRSKAYPLFPDRMKLIAVGALEDIIKESTERNPPALRRLQLLTDFPDLVQKYFEAVKIRREGEYREEQRKIDSLKEI